MKKILSIILSLAVLCLLGGCSLDLSPVDYSAAGNFWKNEAQVETSYQGLMTQFRGDYFSTFLLGETRGGTFKATTSSDNVAPSYVAENTLAQSATNVGDISNWNGYYARLLQVNHFIEQVRDGCDFLDQDTRNLYLAKAYGFRAYYYFMLYRTYGGVPLETEVKLLSGRVDIQDLYMARATAEATMTFLKEEIDRSEAAFGSNRDLDRNEWSYFATEMLKAQIYLWSAKVTTDDDSAPHTAAGQADLEVARTALRNIYGNANFGLLDNFSDVFAYGNKKNKEIILSLHFDKDESTCGNAQLTVFSYATFTGAFFNEDGTPAGDPLDLEHGSGFHRCEYKESFVKSFDASDTRRAGTFYEAYNSADPATRVHGNAVVKFLGHFDTGVRSWDSDWPIYRYADVVLMMAEIENGLGNYGEAAKYINEIRERAYGEGYPEFSESSFAATELAILKERDKEFVNEGSRWWDLLRLQDAEKRPLVFSAEAAYPAAMGETATAILSVSDSYKQLWPINSSVLAADPELKQTVGYADAQ